MSRALRLLVLLAVLWCGLHVSPAEADAPLGDVSAEWAPREDAHADDPSPHKPHASAACHNHCPVAPDQSGGVMVTGADGVPLPPFAAKPKKLVSRSQAPPVQPPSA